jgi:hypothetical protein
MSRSKAERLRRLRLRDLRRLLRDRYGHRLPDDDAGREDLRDLLLPISVGLEPDLKMEYACEIWAEWMAADERYELIADIGRTPLFQRKLTSRQIGHKQHVSNEQRERLRLWTIWPCDMTEEQMKEQRKAKDRARKQHRRQTAGAKPREQALSNLKPWEIQGISRATWFRRQARQESHSETKTSEVKLSYTEDELVSLRKRRVRKRVAEERLRKRRARAGHSTRLPSLSTSGCSPDETVSAMAASSQHEIVSRGGLQFDEVWAHEDPRGQLAANGFAISHDPEDRNPQPTARVWIREIRHPAISSGPDDDLADFKIAARL